MTLYQQILDFYYQLDLTPGILPEKVQVMNPYKNAAEEVDHLMQVFHEKYFSDENPRKLIVGINPGRFGAGLTGIPFTDTPALKNHCGIHTEIETQETSADFVYQFIEAYGGPKKFYSEWFIGGVCPLGFLHLNQKGNWINWNYYDERQLQDAVTPFITKQLKIQKAFCGQPEKCIVLGTGKNYQFLKKLNKSENLFEELIPLEHPRYVMQYKRKLKEQYIAKFLEAFQSY